jgi:hypothetical protein
MDRPTVYTQEQGRSVDFLFAQRATMIGLGKLAQAALGSNTVVRGLAVTPNAPAALNVLVGIGEIYSMAQVDATPWGALPADNTDVILKQGLNMAAQTIATPAPATSGYSAAYLIEAQYQDQDTNPAVLPYYNSNNPQIPLNGQGGNGAPQATQRQGMCVVQAKAGIAAPTGTQVTPSVDSGWTALAVVTVANGQTTVTAGNISVPAGVPQLTSLLQMMQAGSTVYAVDTSTTANQINIALTPAITAYTDGQPLRFQAANNNNGPCNINAGPGNIPLNGSNGAFQGGEIVQGKFYEAVYRANTGTAVVIGQSGGALQIAPATQSGQAVQFGQVAVFGGVRNLKASLAAAGTSLTFTADAIVAKTALNGVSTLLTSYNKTLNIATTGAGGMDTGTAPVSGYVAVYATWGAGGAGIVGTNASSSVAPEQYGGTALPAGVSATQLIGVWPTNASGQLIVASQVDRTVFFPVVTMASSSGTVAGSPIGLAAAIPLNAKTWGGSLSITLSTTGAGAFAIYSNSSLIGSTAMAALSNNAGTGGVGSGFNGLPISTPQAAYIVVTGPASVSNFNIGASTYTF